MTDKTEFHRVVIIGGGFGGLNAAKALRNAPVKITLIDKRNLHLFQPLLYQVATGGLSPADISSPIRAILRKNKNTRTIMAEVRDIDIDSQKVFMDDDRVAGYDSLIVAAGSRHHYFGHDDWNRYAPGLKTIEEALDIRRRILSAFEKAELAEDDTVRRQLLTFIIVGGGPTGVELAGTVGEITRYTISREYRSFDPKTARIILVEGQTRILPAFDQKLSAKATISLEELGVEVLSGTMVTSIDRNSITLVVNDKVDRIKSDTILWAAGVKASSLGRIIAKKNLSLLDSSDRVVVDSSLALPGYANVFVIGDLANYSHQTGEPLPGLAPVAIQQGKYVAKLIKARLTNKTVRPFRYIDKGNLATIGRSRAVGQIGKLKVSGLFAWLVWLFVHLMYLIGFENRLLVFIQWAWNYFTWNRSARIITNVTATPDDRPKI